MRILFFCMDDYCSFSDRGTYTDVMRVMIREGHTVIGVSPTAVKREDTVIRYGNSLIIKPYLEKEGKGSYVKKGLNMVLLPLLIKRTVMPVIQHEKIDAIVYATPPVTIAGMIGHFKKRFHASTYLLLKDMWPQVMVDAGLLRTTGVKGIILKYFQHIEHRLYQVSDLVGCMSPANMQYVIDHQRGIATERVHVSPNSLEPREYSLNREAEIALKEKYGIPLDKKVILYGGNLGILQGVGFLVECLRACKDEDCTFVICGTGTHYHLVEEFKQQEKPSNLILINGLKREDFDLLTKTCDIGLATLDWKCTTPNFPSKILPYMEYSKPVLICSDTATDIGDIAAENGFGWKCPSNDAKQFQALIHRLLKQDIASYGKKAREFLLENYTAEISCGIILREIEALKAGMR